MTEQARPLPGEPVPQIPATSELRPAEPNTAKSPKKPVTLFYLTHGDDTTYQLEPWKNKIEETLLSTTGRVLVFTESAEGRHYLSDGIREKMADGLLPSQAFRAAAFDGFDKSIRKDEYPQGFTEKQRDYLEKSIEHSLTQGFFGAKQRILDHIAARYPGRIDWLEEWNTEEMIEKDNQRERPKQSILQSMTQTLKQDIRRITPQGRAKNLADKRQEITDNAESYSARDHHIAKIIEKNMTDEDVVAFVGEIGALHTGISHQLAGVKDETGENKFQVQREFPGKAEGEQTYYYPPTNALTRAKMWNQDKELSDAEVSLTDRASKKAYHKQFGHPINMPVFYWKHSPFNQADRGESGAHRAQKFYAKTYEWMRKKQTKQEKEKRPSGPGTPHRDDYAINRSMPERESMPQRGAMRSPEQIVLDRAHLKSLLTTTNLSLDQIAKKLHITRVAMSRDLEAVKRSSVQAVLVRAANERGIRVENLRVQDQWDILTDAWHQFKEEKIDPIRQRIEDYPRWKNDYRRKETEAENEMLRMKRHPLFMGLHSARGKVAEELRAEEERSQPEKPTPKSLGAAYIGDFVGNKEAETMVFGATDQPKMEHPNVSEQHASFGFLDEETGEIRSMDALADERLDDVGEERNL